MAFFNYEAKAVVRNQEFKLSQHDIELIEINSGDWIDKSNPPFDLCRYLMELINLRLSKNLDEGGRKKLAASILNMNYFQFNDYLFKAKSGENKRIDLRTQKKNLNTILNSDREKHRQAQEKKLGHLLSPKEHKIAYKANYAAIRKEKIMKNYTPKRLEEVRGIVKEFENLAVDCISLIPSKTKDPIGIGDSKFGGHPHMIESDEFPVDENGKEMVLLAQINVAEINKILPKRLPKEKGLLLFFAADEELAGQNNHRFVVKYYADTSSLRIKKPTNSRSYHETVLQFTKNKSLPISPWPSYVRFEKKMGTAAYHMEEFLQEKDIASGSIFLGYGINIEMRPLIQAGKTISESLDNFIPLLRLSSQYDEGVEKRMMFGDAGAVGFFIRPEDLKNWDFNKVAFTTYN